MTELREALAALKDAKVLRAQLKTQNLELSVEFQVDLPVVPEMGSAPTPGGWKSPVSLDDPFLLDPQEPRK